MTEQLNRDHVLECIAGLLVPSHTKVCEERIAVLSNLQGFGVLLSDIAMSSTTVSIDIRQLSLLILKKYIKEHWETQDLDPSKEAPLTIQYVATQIEKDKIKSIITPGLSDQNSKIRTAIAMCTGRIGAFEWPETWPSLLQDLIKCLDPKINQDINLMNGSLKCLEILCDPRDLTEPQIKQILLMLFPVFLNMLSIETYEYLVQVKIIQIFKNVVSTILETFGKTTKLLKTIIPDWMEMFQKMLTRRVVNEKTANEQFTIQTGIVESLTYIISHFPKMMAPYVPSLINPIWSIFTDYYNIYEKTEVLDEQVLGTQVEGITRIDTLIASILEFITNACSVKILRPMFEPHLDAIIKQTIYYLQMTRELQELWETEPSQFLEQEDETNYHPRVNSSLLLATLCQVYRSKALRALSTSISQHLATSQQLGLLGWRLREATLYAISTAASYYIDAGNGKYFDFATLLQVELAKDFVNVKSTNEEEDNVRKILQGRSLIVASSFGGAVDISLSTPYLQHAIKVLHANDDTHPLPMKLAALKAVSAFCPNIDKSLIIEFVPALLQVICTLLTRVGGEDDVLILVLETLLMVARIDVDITARYEAAVTPALVSTWVSYSTNPLVSDEIRDMIKLLCSSQKVSVYPGIMEHALPTLCTVLDNCDLPLYIGIVEGAIDMIGVIMSAYRVPTSGVVDDVVIDRIFLPILNILLLSDNMSKDNGVCKAALTAMQAVVHRSYTRLVSWVHPTLGISATECLVRVYERHVVNTNEFIAMYAPPIVIVLITHMSTQLRPYLASVLALSLQMVVRSRVPSFKQSLIIIFARLILIHPADVIDHLFNLNTAGYDGNGINNGNAGSTIQTNGMGMLMNEWLKITDDIQTRLNVTLSTVAITKVLGLADSRLSGMMIDGTMMIPREIAGKTRSQLSRSVVAPSIKWTQVRLTHKITMCLINQYKEEMQAKNEAQEIEKKKLAKLIKKQQQQNNQQQGQGGDQDEEEDEDDGFDDEDFNVDDEFEDALEYIEDDDDDDIEDELDDYDPISKEDPYYNLDLINFIKEFFVSLQSNNPLIFKDIQAILATYLK